MMDWDDPAARYRLIDRVGVEEYNRLHAEHRKTSTVATVGGHAIRPIRSARWGLLYLVGETGRAYRTQAEAEAHARQNPTE